MVHPLKECWGNTANEDLECCFTESDSSLIINKVAIEMECERFAVHCECPKWMSIDACNNYLREALGLDLEH